MDDRLFDQPECRICGCPLWGYPIGRPRICAMCQDASAADREEEEEEG